LYTVHCGFQGHQFVTSEEGEYKFCFDNSMSRWTPKTLAFSLFLGPQGTTVATESVEETQIATKGIFFICMLLLQICFVRRARGTYIKGTGANFKQDG
jgi:hypothetical protein